MDPFFISDFTLPITPFESFMSLWGCLSSR